MDVKQKTKSLLKWLSCFELTCKVYDYFRFFVSLLPTVSRDFLWFVHNYIIAYLPCHILRIFSIKYILKIKIGKGCYVHLGVMLLGDIVIGSNTVIGRNTYLGGPLEIGDNVSITAQTYIFGSSHDKDCPFFSGITSKTHISDYVWLGARSMVLPGVHIGKGSILGAQSVATRNIPPFTVYAGSPAKQIGKRETGLKYILNYSPYFN